MIIIRMNFSFWTPILNMVSLIEGELNKKSLEINSQLLPSNTIIYDPLPEVFYNSKTRRLKT